MAVIRNKYKDLNGNFQNIATVTGTEIDVTGVFVSENPLQQNPNEVRVIPYGVPLSTQGMMNVISDLVYNDDQLNNQLAQLQTPLMSEGIFYTKDFNKSQNNNFTFNDLQITKVGFKLDDTNSNYKIDAYYGGVNWTSLASPAVFFPDNAPSGVFNLYVTKTNQYATSGALSLNGYSLSGSEKVLLNLATAKEQNGIFDVSGIQGYAQLSSGIVSSITASGTFNLHVSGINITGTTATGTVSVTLSGGTSFSTLTSLLNASKNAIPALSGAIQFDVIANNFVCKAISGPFNSYSMVHIVSGTNSLLPYFNQGSAVVARQIYTLLRNANFDGSGSIPLGGELFEVINSTASGWYKYENAYGLNTSSDINSANKYITFTKITGAASQIPPVTKTSLDLSYHYPFFVIGDGIAKINTQVVTVPQENVFTTLSISGPTIHNIDPIVSGGNFRCDLIELYFDGTFKITKGPEDTDYPVPLTLANRTDDFSLPLYYIIVHKENNAEAQSQVIFIEPLFNFSGLLRLNKHNDAFCIKHEKYPNNVYEIFRHQKEHLYTKQNIPFDLFDGSASTGTLVNEFDVNFPLQGVGFVQATPTVASGAVPFIISGTGRTKYNITSGVSTNIITNTYIEPNTNQNPYNGWFRLDDIANVPISTFTAKIKDIRIALDNSFLPEVNDFDGIKIRVLQYPKINFEWQVDTTSVYQIAYPISGTQINIPSGSTKHFNAVSIVPNYHTTDIFAVSSNSVQVNDLVFVSDGDGFGQILKIVEIVNNFSIKVEGLFAKPLTTSSKFIIFKNNSTVTLGESFQNGTYINSLVSNPALSGTSQFVFQTKAYTKADFQFSTEVSVVKDKFYFIEPQYVNRTSSVFIPRILMQDNTYASGTQNIWNTVTYRTQGGVYPVIQDGEIIMQLADRFGEISDQGETSDNRFIAGYYTANYPYDKVYWQVIAKDLSDERLKFYDDNGWIFSGLFPEGIQETECWIDLTTSRIAFHTSRIPIEIYATYIRRNYVSNKLTTKDILVQGRDVSLEDWMSNKYPDGKNSGLGYVKRTIGQEGDFTIPGNYTAFMFDESYFASGVNITMEQDAELMVLQKESVNLIDYIAKSEYPGWEVTTVSGTGTELYPEFRFITKLNRRIKIQYFYDLNRVVSSIYSLSKNYDSLNPGLETYSVLYTKIYDYGSGSASGTVVKVSWS